MIIKAYTDIEQSKELAEILPIESADMYYSCGAVAPDVMTSSKQDYKCYTACWSLAALLDYLSANLHVDIKYLDNYWELDCRVQVTYGKELVDACYEMILKLHEQKLL